MYHVYILQSLPQGRYYVGHTDNIAVRVAYHNAGRCKSTKPYRPWKVVYTEEYGSRSEAMKREYAIKSKKSKQYIENIIWSGSSVG